MLSVYSQGASAPRLLKPISREIPARKLGPAPFVALAAALVASALGGCSSTQSAVSSAFSPLASSSKQPMFPESKWGVSASRRVAGENERIPKGGGRYKVGEPYQVGGRWYNPREQPDYDRIGVASWYGSDFHGRHTANGEVFDMNALTAAHPTLPMPSYVYVTNLANDRTILVRVNDRGPYVGERMIDLSRASARELGLMSGGTGRVRVRYAGPAPSTVTMPASASISPAARGMAEPTSPPTSGISPRGSGSSTDARHSDRWAWHRKPSRPWGCRRLPTPTARSTGTRQTQAMHPAATRRPSHSRIAAGRLRPIARGWSPAKSHGQRRRVLGTSRKRLKEQAFARAPVPSSARPIPVLYPRAESGTFVTRTAPRFGVEDATGARDRGRIYVSLFQGIRRSRCGWLARRCGRLDVRSGGDRAKGGDRRRA